MLESKPPGRADRWAQARQRKIPNRMDLEFGRQALAENALAQGQIEEALGAQQGFADQGVFRSLPVIICNLELLPRRRIEQLIRHVIRRRGPMSIGPYDCLTQIGRGGMGIVYKARHRRTEKIVALKLLFHVQMDEKMVERFQHEAKAAANIRHPHIVSALDIGEADGWHYFAMEYVHGFTLSRLISETGSISERRALHIAIQVADALAYAHHQGIIHRDVKPSNILLTADDFAKLCDLGLSKLHDLDETHLHAAGKTLGSCRFISPEQARGLKNADARTDIYSLGLCLYYMVSGELPFADIPTTKVIREHAKGRLPWPARVNPRVSTEMSWIVTRMTAPDPANRYNSVQALYEDLCALEKRLGGSGAEPPEPPTIAMPPPTEKQIE